MSVLYLILGIAIGIMAFLIFTIFISLKPIMFLLGLLVFLVIFAMILCGTAFIVYKIKNSLYGDINYYDFGDFLYQVSDDIEDWYKKYLNNKKNKEG